MVTILALLNKKCIVNYILENKIPWPINIQPGDFDAICVVKPVMQSASERRRSQHADEDPGDDNGCDRNGDEPAYQHLWKRPFDKEFSFVRIVGHALCRLMGQHEVLREAIQRVHSDRPCHLRRLVESLSNKEGDDVHTYETKEQDTDQRYKQARYHFRCGTV